MEQDALHIMEHSALEAIVLHQNQAPDLFPDLSMCLWAFQNQERIPKKIKDKPNHIDGDLT